MPDIAELKIRATQAQDRAGTADLTTEDGRYDIAGAVVDLARVVRDLLAIVDAQEATDAR